MMATISRDIIHPRERFVALPLCKDSNLRDLTSQTGNVQKTSFPFSCPYKRCTQRQDSIDVFDPPCQRMAGFVGDKVTKKVQISINFFEKNHG